MRLLHRGLTTRLLIYFLLLAILPLVATSYIAYNSERRAIITGVASKLESVAVLKEQEIKEWVKDLRDIIAWLVDNPQRARYATVLATHAVSDTEYLAAHDSLVAEFRRMETLADVSTVSLLDINSGQIIASADITSEGKFRKNEQYFIQGKKGAYVSDVFHSLSLGRPTIVVSAPVKDSIGQLVGVLAAHANMEPLSNIMLERSGLGKTGETFLVNRSNLLITNTVSAPDGAFKKWIFSRGVKRSLEGENGLGLFIDYRGEPVIGAYRWLEDFKLALIAEQDQSEAFAPIATLSYTLLGLAVAIALIVIVLALFFARTITHPVRQLVEGTKEIGRGNLDHKVGTAAKDEIGRLSRAFDQMTENLKAITVSRDDLAAEIAERKQAKEALLRERNFINTLVQASPAFFVAIGSDGKTIMMNDSLLDALGYSADEVKDCDYLSTFVPDRDHELLSKIFEKLTVSHEKALNENHILTKAGQELLVEWHGRPVFNEKDDFEYFFGVGIDITERKRTEKALKEYSERLEEMVEKRTKELRDAQEQLVQKERLAVLGQLAGGVAHELRNPLGAIKNAAYFLNMVMEKPEPEVKEALEILEEEVTTSEGVISSLLDFAQPKSPMRRKANINDVLQKALSRMTVPENVDVVSQLDEALPSTRADPDQLGQAFGNIIVNAIQAMPEGGQLSVKSEAPSPKSMTISFADTGIGIAKENLGKLFEPLFTTKARGIGLGLAVTKILVEGHGGTIDVDSKVGKGSTFTVRLPVGLTIEA